MLKANICTFYMIKFLLLGEGILLHGKKKKTFATKMYSIAEISCICCFIILWVSVAVANVVKHVCK